MTKNRTQEITETLGQSDVHDQWEASFRTEENSAFYEEAFDFITGVLHPPENSLILDVGCGIGAHSIRLAKREFIVKGIDFSEMIIGKAEINVREAGLEEKITFQGEDVLSLSFAENSFDYVLCWGVLMHIQEIDKAITEIARVLKPGGWLIVSEGNMHSLQAIVMRTIKKILNKERAVLERTEAGLEYWTSTTAGTLLTRQADIRGMSNIFHRRGFSLRKRTAGQFTELYTRFSSPKMRRIIHALNLLWFRFIKVPGPAFGNLLFFEKDAR